MFLRQICLELTVFDLCLRIQSRKVQIKMEIVIRTILGGSPGLSNKKYRWLVSRGKAKSRYRGQFVQGSLAPHPINGLQ